FQGQECRKGRITVIGDAAGVEAIFATHGYIGSQALRPVAQRRLLVEVPIENDGGVIVVGRLHGDQEHRRTVVESHDVYARVVETAAACPLGQVLRGGVHVAVLRPVRV